VSDFLKKHPTEFIEHIEQIHKMFNDYIRDTQYIKNGDREKIKEVISEKNEVAEFTHTDIYKNERQKGRYPNILKRHITNLDASFGNGT
jgi:hypothetical protein